MLLDVALFYNLYLSDEHYWIFVDCLGASIAQSEEVRQLLRLNWLQTLKLNVINDLFLLCIYG